MNHYTSYALGDLCDVSIGRTPRRSESRYWGGQHPWATIRDLDGDILMSTAEGITDDAVKEVMPRPVEPRTLLFSFKLSIGKMAFAGQRMHHNEAIAALPIRNPNLLDSEFLFYALKAKTHEYATNHAVLGKVLNKRKVEEIQIPLPPLDEQRRIVDVLNRAARIEALRSRAAERLQEFVPALFVSMFGDPVTNPMEWHSKELSSLGTLDRGRSRHRPRNAPHLYGGPHPFVQTGDIANACGLVTQYLQTYSDAGLAQSRIWPPGTLCITIAANIAMTGILTFACCFPDSIVGFQPGPAVTVEYVQSTIDLMQKRLEEGAPRAAQRNINLSILRHLTIPTPPLDLQRRFSNIVNATRAYAHVGEASTSTTAGLTASLASAFLQNSASERGANRR